MPAEWEPHAATWIAWPHNRDDWPGKFAPIPWVYVEIVRLLSRSLSPSELCPLHWLLPLRSVLLCRWRLPIGSLLLLAAFVLLAVETPGHSLLIRDVTAALPSLPHRELILALLVAGFGTKAGLMPMSFWMPLAYDAAPAPAAAALSGAV